VNGVIKVCDAYSKIKLLDYALFDAPPVDKVREAWKLRLEQCTTDEDIMKITLLAQYGNGLNWIQGYVEQCSQSSTPLSRARALTVLGFLRTKESPNLLRELLERKSGSWVKKLLRSSLKRWEENSWAKYWYTRFLNAEDDVTAWAAFRLFRQCVDSRFWFWKDTIERNDENQGDCLNRRRVFLADNIDNLVNKIHKNEKPLREQLFCQKIKHGQVWPWM
jgi:hypothetical protein